MTTGGTLTEYAVPEEQSAPTDITTGPDGAMWFTESGTYQTSAQIGRITTDGHITEYAPHIRYYHDIASGPDGALWFTEGYLHYSIGRVATDGTVTFSQIPPTSSAGDITAGPGNSLWFTDGNGGIGRVQLSR